MLKFRVWKNFSSAITIYWIRYSFLWNFLENWPTNFAELRIYITLALHCIYFCSKIRFRVLRGWDTSRLKLSLRQNVRFYYWVNAPLLIIIISILIMKWIKLRSLEKMYNKTHLPCKPSALLLSPSSYY